MYKTEALPRTLILNGVVDDRNYKENEVPQYSEEAANYAELIMNSTTTCYMSRQLVPFVTTRGTPPVGYTETEIKPRFGSSAVYVHNKVRIINVI